ncbi:MAG: cell division protein ZapE [Steroidobacteraceae bacterium]
MSPDPLLQRYRSALQEAGHTEDAHQREALQSFIRLRHDLLQGEKSAWQRIGSRLGFGKPATTARGLYLWGSVGRGKTWLMDLFYESLPFTEKRRAHFHRFMQSVHAGLKRHREVQDPLRAVAADLSAEARVICLDELFVTDIADAMLLAGLFSHLIERGVTLVFTSNVPPSGLYRDGLQRQRFLPAIDLLEQHCEVLTLDGDTDYRLRQLTQRSIYLDSAAEITSKSLTKFFDDLSDCVQIDAQSIEIEGRDIPVVKLAENVVWFEFNALCEGPRSQNDYVSLAREFQSVLVSNVPVFDATTENAARRFIAMVDEFYDRRVNLVISASAAPTELYRGEKLAFEFERTASRLIEMQSEEYLASEHRPG